MRDLQDWHKQLDLAAKQAKRAHDLAGRPAPSSRPSSVRQDAPPAPEPGDTRLSPPDIKDGPLPPRKGRGPRKAESREELLSRLINPTLTLEETARILEVCPTTVRRWTNKGVLPHERSGGNQRRFKLSVVLDFLDARTSPSSGAE